MKAKEWLHLVANESDRDFLIDMCDKYPYRPDIHVGDINIAISSAINQYHMPPELFGRHRDLLLNFEIELINRK